MTGKIEGTTVGFVFQSAYALPALALALIGIPVYVYIPKFYTDTMGVDITVVASLLLLVRLFDAVTDPLMGYVSDRTVSRYGRRRPYMAVGAVGLSAAVYFLFNPPGAAGTDTSAIWLGAWLVVLFIFWTAVTIPYEALGPEITFDHHERTRLFGLRDGALVAGTLLAATSPPLAAWLLKASGKAATEPDIFFAISVVYAPLIVAAVWYCVWRIQENDSKSFKTRSGFFSGLRTMPRNRPFLILLGAYVVSAFGSNLPATLILYYVQYVLRIDHAEIFLLLYFITGVCFLPLWIRISKRMGKKNAWLLSMSINTGAFAGVYFLGDGDALAYGILVFLSGIGFGAGLAIPSSIQADVIDYDEFLSGERREGRYMGIWSIAKKLSAALGVGIGLHILGLVGYQANAVQNDAVILTLRMLYALVPCICNMAAIIIATAYPITEARHREILIDLQKRQQFSP